MKKITIIFLTIFIAFFIAQTAHLQAQTWPPTGMNGNGSSTIPWEITTAEHLEALATYVNTGNGDSTVGKYYILINDIDLDGWAVTPGDTCGWESIGDICTYGYSTYFQGNFNGNGKVVENLMINRPMKDNIGLFGRTYRGTIQNLGVKNCNIKGNNYVGGLVGYNNRTTIINDYATGSISGRNYVGGLVGYNNVATINNSYTTGSISGNSYIGGLVGYNNDYSTITNSYTTGRVSGGSKVGGLVGENYYHSTITNSYTTGRVSGSNYLGGLIGSNTISTFYNCLAANDTVIATQNTTTINRISGYCDYSSTAYNNYALTGMVLRVNGTVVTRTDDNSVNGISKSLDTLKALEFYNTGIYWGLGVSWNIDSVTGGIWTICDHASFPYFCWQQSVVCPHIIIIAASAEGSGSIIPSGFVAVDNGEDQMFTFTPASGDYYYYIDSVFVDGIYNADAVASGSYTFTNVTANHRVHVKFSTDAHIINAIAGDNGSITPSGNIMINPSDSQNFTFSANPGFIVDSLLVDGVNIPDSIAGGSYTFYNVTEEHTIKVCFKLDFCGGDGTAANPYQICTAKELASLATYVNAGNGNATSGKYYILMDNIDLADWEIIPSDTCGWNPIGNNSIYYNTTTRFQGNFNGTGKVVQNLIINRPTENYIGLFGYTDGAIIQNLGIENCNIIGYNHVGGLVGKNGNYTFITNSYANGSLIGMNYYVGGLVGENFFNSTITNSYATCNVSGGRDYTGGLAGANSDNSTIANSYATGSISGGREIGGLVGGNYNNSTITNSYTTGSVSGSYDVGGLVGSSSISTVHNCLAANDTVIGIQNPNTINRILGHNYNSNIHTNYTLAGMVLKIDGTVVTQTDDNSLNGISKSLDTLKNVEFYNTGSYWHSGISWDIDPITGEIWTICDSVTYPFFRWQNIVDCPHRIIATAGNYGNITPSGFVVVDHGEDQMLTFIPDTGFYVDSVFVDGNYTASAFMSASYTFNNLAANHTIHVTFATDANIIVASTDNNNGNITPSGNVLVDPGDNQTFTFVANPGFIVDSLLINGVNTPDSISSGSYTFYNVTEDHTIKVCFKLDFCGGDGTAANPYQICTIKELASLAAYINAGNGDATAGKYYILMNDIDLTGWEIIPGDTCGWKPIGANTTFSGSTHFQGNFNGAGKVVRNLTINRPTEDHIGLFGCINGATVQNLGIENCNIKGYRGVGGLVGYNYMSSITNTYTMGDVCGNGYVVGGLVGYNYMSSITNSYAISSVNGGSTNVGGLVGWNDDNSTITNSYATGNVSGNDNVGGLVGYNYNNSTITNSHATGNINGNDYVGGLVGGNYNNSTITNGYATGTVSGHDNVGGLVGGNWYYCTITNAYATGSISGNKWVGGLLGFNFHYSTLTNGYTTGNLSGNDLIGGLVGINYYSSTIQNCVAANDSVITTLNTSYINRIVGLNFIDYGANTYHNNYALSGMVLMKNGIVVARTDDNSENGISKNLDTLKNLEFYNTESYWYEEAWDIDPVSGEIWTICDHVTFPYFRWQQNVDCPYIITATARNNGIITPSGFIVVNHGENKTFRFIPEQGNTIAALFVDDSSIQIPENYSYTFEHVTDNHTIHVDFSVGINDYDLENVIVLYPNPATYQVTLKIETITRWETMGNGETLLKEENIELYDVYGKLLQFIPVFSSTILIDISNLSSGVYFLQVNTKKGVVTKKLVKK